MYRSICRSRGSGTRTVIASRSRPFAPRAGEAFSDMTQFAQLLLLSHQGGTILTTATRFNVRHLVKRFNHVPVSAPDNSDRAPQSWLKPAGCPGGGMRKDASVYAWRQFMQHEANLARSPNPPHAHQFVDPAGDTLRRLAKLFDGPVGGVVLGHIGRPSVVDQPFDQRTRQHQFAFGTVMKALRKPWNQNRVPATLPSGRNGRRVPRYGPTCWIATGTPSPACPPAWRRCWPDAAQG